MFDLSKLKLDTSADIQFKPPASDEMVGRLEKHYSHSLPEELTTIFKKYHGGYPGSDCIELIDEEDGLPYDMDISSFLVLDSNYESPINIWFLIKQYTNWMGENSIPFAEDLAQNIFYLNYKNNNHEVWYLAHHEVEETETYKICDTFEQFLNSMYTEED